VAASRASPPRLEQHRREVFDQILRENALFFNILVSFSFTAAVAEPAWAIEVKNINLNLITREVRDAQGRQLVRVRLGGVVRKNNNVELDILNESGLLVGKSFFGYSSGQLEFYDRNARSIISGSMDSQGDFVLHDLRLPEGERDLAKGFVDPCFYCGSLAYGWYDGLSVEVGGGRMYPWYPSGKNDRLRIYWTFERGILNSGQPAAGEAEYDLTGEATGAINSVLFDTDRTAESFFANPYSLVPEPAGRALLPRFTDQTGIAVTNGSGREISITYVARRPNGSVISGAGIENPVTYQFAAGEQLAAFPAEIFRGLHGRDRRPILGAGEVGWMEIYSDDGDIQAEYLDADSEGTALDGNVGGEIGGDPLVFPDLLMAADESTEIELLNLTYDDVIVRLELLDREGRVLSEEREFFVAGNGMRNFYLGGGSNFLRPADPSRAAGLRISCNNDNSIRSSSCSKLLGLATYKDRFGSLASAYAVVAEAAGPVLVAPFFVAGRSDGGEWDTTVHLTKLDGALDSVYLDLYDSKGDLLLTLAETVAAGSQAAFTLNGSNLPWGDRLTTGYARLRSASGRVAGYLSVRWSDGRGSRISKYPLANALSPVFQFNQLAHGLSGGIEYWTGIALMNDLNKPVKARLEVIGPDGKLDRATEIALRPYEQCVGLLSQILADPGYTRLDGYLRAIASDPISGIVLYGDARNQFLSAVPGVPR